MLRPEGSAAGLEVVGQLAILADDAPLQVEFRGGAIEVVLPDLRTALDLRKRLSRGERRAWARSVQSILARTGLELQVWVRRHQVGRLAATSRRGWLAVWLGVDPLELRTGAILATLLSRNPPAVDGGSVVDPGSETK
jgi:hypothetical protein